MLCTSRSRPLMICLGMFNGVWAVAWRSVVYLPLMLLAFVGQLALGIGLMMLPLVGVGYIYCGSLPLGTAMLIVWAALLWAWRRFKLVRLYQDSAPAPVQEPR